MTNKKTKKEFNGSLSRDSPVAWRSFLGAYIASFDQQYEVPNETNADPKPDTRCKKKTGRQM
jgi:hypothetical protein